MQYLLGLIILSIVVSSFIKLRIGIAIYLVYLFLIPYMSISIGGVNLSYNFVNTLILVAFALQCKRKKYKVDWSLIKPFFWLYLLLFIAIPFQDETPFSFAMNQFRLEIMTNLIFPFVMWNVIKNDVTSIKLYRNIIIICIIIAVAYGLFLTTTGGLNPYIMLMASLNGAEFNEAYVMLGGGRMFGRLSSVFTHPMMFALNLGFFLIYIYSLKNQISKWIWTLLLLSITVNIFTCGVRSGLGGIAIVFVYYLLVNRNLKILFYAGILTLIGYLIIINIPEMYSFVASIADVNATKTDVGGSSVELRLNQLEGCLKEIKDCSLFGKGYGWTEYYTSDKGLHPVILAFESLIYIILCNWGVWGIFVWCIFIYKWYNKTSKASQYKTLVPIMLMLYYITYSCITGEYGYMKFFIIFYVLILGEMYCRNKELYKKYLYETKSTSNSNVFASISPLQGE